MTGISLGTVVEVTDGTSTVMGDDGRAYLCPTVGAVTPGDRVLRNGGGHRAEMFDAAGESLGYTVTEGYWAVPVDPADEFTCDSCQ